MDRDPPAPPGPGKERLLGELRRVLRGGMGVRALWRPRILAGKPVAGMGLWLLIYALVWASAEAAARAYGFPSEPKLVSLLVWGGVYAVATMVLAFTTNSRVFATIEHDIIEHAPDAYLNAVADDLAKRYGPGAFMRESLLIAAIGAMAGLLAIRLDIDTSGGVPIQELLLWAVSFFYYFVAAARVVRTSRFYLSFSRCLEPEPPPLYVMSASETPLIRGLASLGAVLLRFWTWIFMSVLSIMLFALLPLGEYGFGANSIFLFVLVPLGGFFSVGFGSIAYFQHDRRIRDVLRRFAYQRAADLQEEVNALLDPAVRRTSANREQLQRLADWHDRIVAGGRYGRPLPSLFNFVLPILLPTIIGVIQIAQGWM